MNLRLDSNIIYVSDMARSAAFYRDVLGLQPRSESDMWTDFESGGVTLALHPTDEASRGAPEGRPGGTVELVFAVDDIEDACRQLRERGVNVDGPRMLEGIDILAAFLRDPDGVAIELTQPAPTTG